MEVISVNGSHTLTNAAAQLRPRLIHGQEDTGNFEPGIEFLLYCPDHLQYIRDTFTGQKMRLDRNNTVI